jgi:hypothetical protein
MKWMVLAVICADLMVNGQEAKPRSNAHKRDSTAERKDATNTAGQTVITVNQQAPQGQGNNHASKPPSYLHELLLPQNVPNLALVIVGIAGIVTAIYTLKRLGRQAVEMRLQRIEMTRQRHETRRQRRIMGEQLEAMTGQLRQMENAGGQTDSLIKQATRQVAAIESQVELMKTAGTHTEDLARQAVRQTDLTQRQLDLANRPWISIDFVKAASNLEFRDDGCVGIFFSYQIRNAGHSVAQHILPWIEPIINGVDNPVEVRARISEQLKRPIDSPFDHGRLIFPNQVISDRYPVLIRPETLDNALDKSPFRDRDGKAINGIGLEIFVCFDYQSTLDSSKHHQTQSMYLVSYGGMGLFLASQKSYGMQGLTLVFKGFGAYAD